MKQAYSLNAIMDEYLTCEFHEQALEIYGIMLFDPKDMQQLNNRYE
ncbi:MAG: hypothetical protein GZ094_22830 [Mariniphaga sp.]|nr:hypothetical protein [Mariniphaga sp.]